MRLISLPALASFCVLSWAACQSSHTQSRVVISDPSEPGPPVIQIRSGQGEVRTYQPESARTESAGQQEGLVSTDTGTQKMLNSPTQQTASAPRRAATPKVAYNSVQTRENVLAITFDDGPHPTLTPKLLDILKQRNVKATFYVLGSKVQTHPEIIRRMVEEGHEIGNHTWSHPSLNKIGTTRVKSELDRTTDIIQKTAGVTPKTMRPPYGATNTNLNRRMNDEFALKVIMWSVDPQDWRYRNSSRVSGHLTANAKPGDILLAHDIHASTIAAMPSALDNLLAKGFRFVTVSELLEMDSIPEPAPPKPELASVSQPSTDGETYPDPSRE